MIFDLIPSQPPTLSLKLSSYKVHRPLSTDLVQFLECFTEVVTSLDAIAPEIEQIPSLFWKLLVDWFFENRCVRPWLWCALIFDVTATYNHVPANAFLPPLIVTTIFSTVSSTAYSIKRCAGTTGPRSKPFSQRRVWFRVSLLCSRMIHRRVFVVI